MRNILIMGVMALGLLGCEQIPDCAYDDSCTKVLPNLSSADFSSEPHKLLIMENRDSLPDYFQIMQVQSPYRYPEGTIVVDTPNRLLYLIGEKGLARRYPIAVGKEGYQFEGQAQVGRMVHWPLWYPTPDMIEKNPELPEKVEGGEENPLGARAIYLYDGGRDTLYRIHGNNQPYSIGRQASAGCIRMYNEDVIDLYGRVGLGTKVVVIGMDRDPSVEVEVIGSNEVPLRQRELTTWEKLFYEFKNQGASDQQATDRANAATASAASESAKSIFSVGGIDLTSWLRSNSADINPAQTSARRPTLEIDGFEITQ